MKARRDLNLGAKRMLGVLGWKGTSSLESGRAFTKNGTVM